MPLLVVVFSLPVVLQSTDVRADEPNLTLTLELGKSLTVLGEPIYISVQLKNNGSSPILIFPSLYPEDRAIQIEIEKSGEKPWVFLPLYIDTNNLEMVKLAPGDSINAAFPIFYGGRGWSFKTAGTYQLSVSFVNPADRKQLARSEPLNLIIRSGDGAGIFLINDEKASTEAGKFLLWQSGDHLRGGIAHLEELIENYPDSPIVDYARLAFAHSLSYPFRDFRIGKVRSAKPEVALEHLKKINMNRLPDYMKIVKLVSESTSLKLLGKSKEAQSILRQARDITEKRPSLRPIFEQAIELQSSTKERPRSQ